ncbi:MAG: outer membrane porin, OprD family [Helicobacteraceae bacterium]|nr:outer membrane porin, OprD family [Helicobacteraceae bacterium]
MKMFYIVLLTLLSSTLISANESFISALKNTKVESQLRYFSMRVNIDELNEEPAGVYENHLKSTKASNAVGGYIGFVTPTFNGLNIGVRGYTSQPIFNNPKSEGGLDLLRDNQDGYSVLGEAFVKYRYKNSFIKAGRQLLSEYGFLSDKDIRMTPYTYEGVVIENRDFKNITLRVGDIFKVKPLNAVGFTDFINASGNTLKHNSSDRHNFVGSYDPNNFNASGQYIGPNQNLYLASFVFTDESTNFEAWNYYCENFVNSFYTTLTHSKTMGDFKNSIGVQGVKQDSVGDHVIGQIDTYALGLKLKSKYKNFSLKYALNKTRYNENSYNGGELIINWGNNRLFNSLYYNDSQEAGAFSNSITATYDSLKYNTSLHLVASKFDFPNDLNDRYTTQDNNEYDIVLNYKAHFDESLNIALKLIYVDFKTNYDFAEYERVHGYDIAHINNTISEVRFIMNYTF